MTYLVARTCTEVVQLSGEKVSQSIELLRSRRAYVLLGDPGSGKTASFEAEARACNGHYVTARDFLALSLPTSAYGKTIFIDGLDESRTGEGDGRTPLDRIRSRLDELGRPSFRLSCREADWLGVSDRNALEAVVPVGELSIVHLDQLTKEQIRDILAHHPAVLDPTEFLKNAEEKGLDALLQNPQTLHLLIEAVKENEWPRTRQETFRLACEKLAAEPNPEHRTTARSQSVNAAALLHASGALCTIQLFADISGFTETGETHQAVHALRDIGFLGGLPVSLALKTRLFVGIGEGQFAPAHRSVAEYLSAHYLSQLIEKEHLPIGRVLALMTAEDGGVIAGLRGLNAWLSVHHPPSRYRLIKIDPLGVALYGDTKLFSVDDKLTLLKAIHGQAQQYSGFRWQDWSAKPFGALATADMVPHIKSILASPARDEGSQAYTDCVIDAVRFSDPLPQLKDELNAAISDLTRWPRIRHNALKAYIHLSGSQQNDLREIAEGIRDGKIEDPEDEMLGVLLNELFPDIIKAVEVFSYLHKPKNDHLIGMYHMFWSHKISEAAGDSDVPILLDVLATEKPPVLEDHKNHGVTKMVGKLLCRAIKEQGDEITNERLYKWFGTALDKHDFSRIDREESACIKDWLETRPERYKGILLVGIAETANKGKYQIGIYKTFRRLFGARPPDDLGLWWLSCAEIEQDQEKADCLFFEAIGNFYNGQGAAGLSVEFFEQWVAERPRFASVYRSNTQVKIPTWRREDAQRNCQYKEEEKKCRDEWIQNFRSHLSHILTGDAHPKVLHDLASAYLGHLIDAHGQNGLQRLQSFLNGDEELISAALEGLRRSIDRPNLPAVDEILELDVKGKMHYIRQACLAGMEERYKSEPSQVLDLGDTTLEKAVAFQYTYSSNEQAWFKVCVRNRPNVVAKVLIRHVIMQVKAKKEHINGLYPLAYDEEYEGVALLAVAPLLRAFPSRVNKKLSFSVLGNLLKSALRHLSDQELTNIINEKLSVKTMDVTQRIYWHAAGIVVDFCQYEAAINEFMGRSHNRRQVLASFFFNDRFERWLIRDGTHVGCLSYLIRLLAPICSPEWPQGGGFVSQDMQTTDFVRALLNRLVGIPTQAANEEIHHLLGDSNLSPWHGALRHALHAHRVSLRESTFRHPTVQEVCDTLDNRYPANATDLAALITEHLRELANEICNGNTDQYKQFWNVDQYARPRQPRPEDACRDSLLARLQDRLRRLGIEAVPEGHYTNDKRADIRVSYTTAKSSMAIPIEIKRDSHPDLWKAISDQLINLYTRDPESKGRGIFLALWFGGMSMPAPPDSAKPTSATELEKHLIDLVPADKKELISVCVIDCSLH